VSGDPLIDVIVVVMSPLISGDPLIVVTVVVVFPSISGDPLIVVVVVVIVSPAVGTAVEDRHHQHYSANDQYDRPEEGHHPQLLYEHHEVGVGGCEGQYCHDEARDEEGQAQVREDEQRPLPDLRPSL